jgi:hypothetical protein
MEMWDQDFIDMETEDHFIFDVPLPFRLVTASVLHQDKNW